MSGGSDVLEDVTIGDVGPSSRVLIWAFRNIASGRRCDARLAMGLSSVVEPGSALDCARAVRVWLNTVREASKRDLCFGGLPHRGLTWDEIALLTTIAAGAGSAVAYAIWWRRLGCEGVPVQRLPAITIAELLKLRREIPKIPGVTAPVAPRHEPEVHAQARTPDTPRAGE